MMKNTLTVIASNQNNAGNGGEKTFIIKHEECGVWMN